MPFCTCRDCLRYGLPLPDSKFKDKDRTYKQCSQCRKRQLEFKHNGKRGLNSRGFKLHVTAPGTEPQFQGEWDKRMWQEWLRGLVGQVERS